MPDIIIPNTFVDGAASNAEQVSENTYLPKSTPDNLEVINGRLTNPNRDGWSINREDVRRGHFSQSNMVAATANQDFFDDTFLGVDRTPPLGFPDVPAIKEAKVIPGCGVAFYVPWESCTTILTWHLSLIVDVNQVLPLHKTDGSPYSVTGELGGAVYQDGITMLMLFLDGLPTYAIRRTILNGASAMAYDPLTPGVYNNNAYVPDTRDWTGNLVFDNSAGGQIGAGNIPIANWPNQEGWHTADIRIVFPPNESSGVGVRQVRVKTRRMGYTLIR